MPKRQEPAPPVLVDHPEPLGRLAPIFARRRMAMAADVSGELVLVRPDSGVIDTRDDDDFARVVRVVEGLGDRDIVVEAPRARTAGGLLTFRIPGVGTDGARGEERYSVTRLASVLATLRAAGLEADPNHIMLASQGVHGSPVGAEANFTGGMMWTAEVRETTNGYLLRSTSDPAPPVDPSTLRRRLDLPGARPRVLVLDTGLQTLDSSGAPFLHAALSDSVVLHKPWKRSPEVEAIDDEDEPDDDRLGYLDFEGGHGTFISGVIRQICPDAEIHVAGVLSSFGDGDVSGVINAFERVLRQTKWPPRRPKHFDVVVMSFGGYMTDDQGSSFSRALLRLIGPNGVGVSAAGNQATSRRYYPAADPEIVGVGALGQDGRAWFSNFGGWVDACAPGIDVASTFFEFTDPPYHDLHTGELVDPGRTYEGWARWSGTSFSAPKVAAVIAQEQYLTGGTARDAWKRLSHYQRFRYPDLGTVFNV